MGIKSKQPVGGASCDGNTLNTRLTADRYELKYVLPLALADELLAAMDSQLAPHIPEHALAHEELSVPGWEQHISTIYLDTAGHDMYRACLAGDADEKVRIKEYRPGGADVPGDLVWVEVKKSSGSRSQKERMAVPREVLDGAIAAGTVSLDTIMTAVREHREPSRVFLQHLWRLQRQYRRPLLATAIVCYRRRAWQDSAGALRITIDEDLRVSPPLPEGAQRFAPLVPHDLGQARLAEESVMLLEVKYRGSLPDWLADSLYRLPPARLPSQPLRPFSKFLAASEAVTNI